MLPCRRGPARAAPARPEHRSHTQVAKFVAASVSRPAGAELFGDASCPAGTAVRTHAVVRAGCYAVRRGVARARGNGPTRRSPAPPRRGHAFGVVARDGGGADGRTGTGASASGGCCRLQQPGPNRDAVGRAPCGAPTPRALEPRRRQPSLLEPCTAGDWSQLT